MASLMSKYILVEAAYFCRKTDHWPVLSFSIEEKWRCCGADKHVDSANDLSLMLASSDSQRQWREQRQGNRYNKSDDLLSELQACV